MSVVIWGGTDPITYCSIQKPLVRQTDKITFWKYNSDVSFGIILQGWDAIFQDARHVYEQWPTMWCYASSETDTQGSGTMGWPQTPWSSASWRIIICHLHDSRCHSLEILIPREECFYKRTQEKKGIICKSLLLLVTIESYYQETMRQKNHQWWG